MPNLVEKRKGYNHETKFRIGSFPCSGGVRADAAWASTAAAIRSGTGGSSRRPVSTAELPIFLKFSANCRSFSAASAPIFASKYAFYSIFENLPDYLAEFFLVWQNFAKIAT